MRKRGSPSSTAEADLLGLLLESENERFIIIIKVGEGGEYSGLLGRAVFRANPGTPKSS
jgi:hypothetical protein